MDNIINNNEFKNFCKNLLENANKKEIIIKIENWFNWYDNQISQANRALRTKTIWSANDGEKNYYTIEELDLEANKKQIEIRQLKSQLLDEV